MTAVQDAVVWSPDAARPTSRWRGTRTLLRDPIAAAGLVLLVLIVAGAVLAPVLSPSTTDATDFLHRFAAPSGHHPLGTDELGRDELTRLLYGARVSLSMAAGAALAASAIGLLVGLVAGFYGGVADQLLMRVVDGLQALPGLILALAVAGLLGPGLVHTMIAVVVVWWTGYARVVRSMVLSVRERQFVDAARGMGASDAWIVVRHVLPNVVGPAIVLVTLELAHILLALAALSFLGLGISPPTPEWGSMLSEAKDFLDRAPQLVVMPGVAITLVALACNLVGDGLRDALDPRLHRDVLG